MCKYVSIDDIKTKINNYKVISFDIFDTLIKRDCSDPTRVFYLIQNQLGEFYPNFAKNRIDAESRARQLIDAEEISIDDIYSELSKTTGWDSDKLLSIELEMESRICKVNREMHSVFRKALELHKYIIITSDMYLKKDFIEDLLKNAGIVGYDRLYLSSDYRLTKNSGNLYKRIVADLKSERLIIKASEILHIGDNKKSDYRKAIENGIDAVKIQSFAPATFYTSTKIKLTDLQQKEYKDLISFISNNESEEYCFFQKIGYECLGPVLYGFTDWVKKEIQKKDINKVYFLSRDGQIMKKAWDCVEKESPATYMYGSRRAYIVPTLWMCKDIQEMLSSMFMPRIGTIRALISKFGLIPQLYEKLVSENGLNIDEYYEYDELFSKKQFSSLMNYIVPKVISNSKKEYDTLVKYLKSIEFFGNVALIDIGWHANMQKALIKVCKEAGIKVDIYGLYIGINPNVDGINNNWSNSARESVNAKGYLFEKGKNEYLFNYEKNFTSIFEMMFSADHGSIVKFDNYCEPVMMPFEYCDTDEAFQSFEAIMKIQGAALDYLEDSFSVNLSYPSTDSAVVFSNLLMLGNFPTNEIAEQFGDLLVLDDKVCSMAKPKRLFHYIKNWKDFSVDYHETCWKIGFFKRLLNINIPYYFMRNVKDMFCLKRKR